MLAEVERSAETTVTEAVNDLEVRLASLEESTDLLAEIVAAGDYSETQLRELLREAVDEREDLFGAALALDPRWSSNRARGFAPYYYYLDGQMTFSDLAAAYDYPLVAWFRDALSAGKPVWTEPYFDEGGGNVYMTTYSAPIFKEIDGERVFYGVVTADITLDELQYYLDRMELGPNGFGFLLSRSGKMMAARNRDNLLRPLLQVLPADQDLALWGGLLTDVASGQKASAAVACRETDRCIIKLAPLQSTLWPLGVYYSEYEMLAPLREYLVATAISSAITLGLLLIGVIWVARRITRPLRAMAIATVDIATGNFHTPLPPAKSRDELGRLMHSFSLMQDNLQRYVDQLEAETASRNRLEGELNAATEIQMSMLPAGGRANVEEGAYSLWAALRPAKSVGGDLYTFHLKDPDCLFIAVGDVSDKGVPAALFMARAMTLLQQYVQTDLAPGEIMARLNDELVEGNDNCMFLTLFLGWVHLDTLMLEFASGGHTPPTLRRNGVCQSLEQEDGPALGLMESIEFPVNRIQLRENDMLAVFTDGVDEAFNEDGEQFGIEAFNAVLANDGERGLDSLGDASFEAIDDYAGETPQSDDITIMLLEIRGAEVAAHTLDLAADGNAAGGLLAWLGEQLEHSGLDEGARAELKLVAEEVVTNIVKYGQLEAWSKIHVRLEKGGGGISLEFRDAGIPFDPLAEAQRSELGAESESAAIGGLGVHLLEALTDAQEYSYRDGENRLRLFKRLH
jgi:sigma-B regulation protein RsbU (phosphoserine phosphatase)